MPLEHWSYQFIERLQAKGVLGDLLSNIKPYSRDKIAEMVIHISSLEDMGEIRLSELEINQLNMLKKELAQELAERGITDIREYNRLLKWSDGEKSLITRVGFSQSVYLEEGTEDYKTWHSDFRMILMGNLNNLFFYNDSRISYEYSDKPRPVWEPYFTRYPWENYSNAYLVFRLPWSDLQIGKDEILWGAGYHGVIGLSGVKPAFDIIKLPLRIWKVKFVSILGFLRDDLLKEHRSDIVRKYLSAHRIEIIPFPGLCIGFQEVYIYAGELHIELLNPVMIYQIAEDYLGDIGNNTVECDIDLCILPNTRLYGSLFMDDYHFPEESLFSYTPNRWAVLSGILIVDPFGLDNFDLRAEYARVEPWTYTHKGIIQNPPIATSYKHFDTPLGHWIGPNADDLFFEAKYQFSANLSANIWYNRIRKGEIGGSLYDYFTLMDMEKHFLMGVVEKGKTLGLGVIYRFFNNSALQITYEYTKIENRQTEEAKLPGNDPGKEVWKTGNNYTGNRVFISVTLSY
jgi:hypothetical protein